MKVMLGSGGFRSESRREVLCDAMRRWFGDIDRLLFVPYALADGDAYVQLLRDRGLDAGYELDGLHAHADPIAAVAAAEAIYVGGGNTFRLVNELHRRRLMEPIRERVSAGMPYLGVSAGSNVACPTLMTTNDMPIVMPPSFATLGLVPFQLNPHYFSGSVWLRDESDGGKERFEQHFGETRDDRIREYHELNDLPVIGLWEGGILEVDGGSISLTGAPARVFRRNEPALDVQPGERIVL